MLSVENKKFHIVCEGQTLQEIAVYYSVSEYLLVRLNGLSKPPFAGQILRIPSERGNAYIVREGDTKTLLCGSIEGYEKKNGTDIFYIGMRVIL
jgi:LysM repeat protein